MLLRKINWCIISLALLTSACGRHRQIVVRPSSSPLPGESQEAPVIRPGYVEVGYASWYGDPYHGRRTANGEVYDKNKLTAAHLTLPFETMVKVTNLENHRTVEVRITDRGPFVKGRILDLSLAGAQELRMVGPGTALVRVEVLSVRSPAHGGAFAVQVGAFREREAAQRLQARLKSRYGNAFVVNYSAGDGIWYRVRVGPKPTVLEARKLASRLGEENLPAFIVRTDN